MTTLSPSVVKKIQMSKLLYDLGDDCFRVSENIEKVGSGIILLQDSVELFLIGLCEHLVIGIDDNIAFDKYFVKFQEKTKEEVPLKKQMLVLNRQRVIIKHHGVLPNPAECVDFSHQVKDFFIELSSRYFGMDYNSISLVDLLDEGKIKEFLKEAEAFLKEGKYEECQINCRKAIYLTFERKYDIRDFEDEKNSRPFFGALLSEAPYFARNKQYIDDNIKEPVDYICIDHDRLNMELLQNDILPVDYWNIWRLTPALYYYSNEDIWVVQDEFGEDRFNKENADYCFRKTVEILLLMYRKKGQTKSIKDRGILLKIKKGKIPVYLKATNKSKVTFEFDNYEGDIYCHSRTVGLDGDKVFYEITHKFEETGKNKYVFGYISEDDINFS